MHESLDARVVDRHRLLSKQIKLQPQKCHPTQLLLTTVVTALRDHPGVWMWNLGSEPDLFAWPPDHRAGRAWAREMVALIHGLDPTRPVACGLHLDSQH